MAVKQKHRMAGNPYNLCKKVEIPVEIQLQDDSAFLNEFHVSGHTKISCTKRQLQSLIGSWLYVHKCVKPARFFLNRMLELLCQSHNSRHINLTNDFKRDLLWFRKFLPLYNSVSMYGHKVITDVIELDACLTGLGGRYGYWVYHLPIPNNFKQLSIVHLEMINILLAVRLFTQTWKGRKILIKCDNVAVVNVMKSGRARDPFLGACARSVWFESTLADTHLHYGHIMGKRNRVADLLSRYLMLHGLILI